MLKEECKSVSYMMHNGVDMELYVTSFDPSHIATVRIFLSLFKWDKKALKALQCIEKKYNIHGKSVVSTPKKRQEMNLPEAAEPHPLQAIMETCPLCSGIVRGWPLSACMTRDTNRVFLRECDDCSYYAETFNYNDKIIVTEGE